MPSSPPDAEAKRLSRAVAELVPLRRLLVMQAEEEAEAAGLASPLHQDSLVRSPHIPPPIRRQR